MVHVDQRNECRRVWGATTNQQPLFNADTQFQFNWGHSYTTACQSAGHADTGGFKQAQIPTGTDPLLAGTWYNIAATYDGATIRVYLNGVLKGSIGAGTPVLTAGLDFAVGNRPPLRTVGTVKWTKSASAALSARMAGS